MYLVLVKIVKCSNVCKYMTKNTETLLIFFSHNIHSCPKVYIQLTFRFTFSAAISKSLELKKEFDSSLKSPKQFPKNTAIKIRKASSTVSQNWFE